MAAPTVVKSDPVAVAPPPKPPAAPAGVASSAGETRCKKWQMEMMMERLRSKTGQFKSFAENAKSLKIALLDKRYPMDLMERQQLQRCLDALQHSFKVTSLQAMVERLGTVTRQYGLKFMAAPSGTVWFISSDMFYLEVVLEQSGSVKDVKINHEGKMERQSCEDLVNCLERGDFADFAKQLEGLAAIYQINADKKQKGKVFQALQSLETDLTTLAEIQAFIKEPHNLVHKSPVGVLERRKGGHPMRLTFFVSPYDLLDEQTKSSIPLTVENVVNKRLGQSVEICNEASGHYKLPTSPLITITTSQSGKRSPIYANLGQQNSATLPATFVLRLRQPMPMCVNLVRSLQQITEVECGDLSTQQPMLSLITRNCSSGALDCANNKGLFVTLPDQQHCYFLTEGQGLSGIMLQTIPFTHPTHVPQILSLLRQQALFNSLVESCVRPGSKQDFEDLTIFEVSALSRQQLSISFEHPMEEAMATVELDLSDVCSVGCRLYGPVNDQLNMTEFASKVVQRSLSIPITMRALIQKWQQQAAESTNSDSGLGIGLGFGSDSKVVPDFECKPVVRSSDQSSGGSHGGHVGSVMNHLGYQASPEPFFPSQITVEPIGPRSATPSPLLLNMLGEQLKAKKRRRSKAGDAPWTGRSPKRKMSTEEDMSEDTQGSYDSLGGATPNAEMLDDVDAFEMEEAPEAKRRKNSCESKNSSENHQAFEMAEGKSSLVGPSVSITPIASAASSSAEPLSAVLGLEKRPGIEIIPLGGAGSAPPLPSSITITPIKPEERQKDRSGRDDKSKSRDRRPDEKRPEKKKKRHRDEGDGSSERLMGPPQPPNKDKIKTEPSAASPPLARKYPTSPGDGSSSTKTPSSPTPKSKSSSSSHSSSPKHSSSSSGSSPSYGSPKHSAVSPKHSSPSPKSSSGKPSMSALKSASSSSSSSKSSSSSSSSSSSDPNRVKKDKEKKSSSSSSLNSSPKSKSSSSSSSSSSSLKGKQDFSLSGGEVPASPAPPPLTSVQKVAASLLELEQAALTPGTLASDSQATADSPPPQSAPGAASLPAASAHSSSDQQTCSTPKQCQQVRNRKGSLSAVIDKLKSAQTSPEHSDSSDRPKSSCANPKPADSKNGLKNSEYMVKSSSDGIKITINKTKKESKSYKSSSSLPSSPKHTGLKPGVISGPASKKPQQKSSSSSRTSSPSSSKSSSSSSFSSKGSLSPSGSKSSKSNSSSPKSSSKSKSDKSSSKDRRSSPSTFRDEPDGERAFKILAAQAKLEVEMPKLDTKFHIPKLSRSESKDAPDKKNKDPETKKFEERDRPSAFASVVNAKLNPVVALPMLPTRTESPSRAPPPVEKEEPRPRDLDDPPELSPPKPLPDNKGDCDSDDSSHGLRIDFALEKKMAAAPPNLLPAAVVPKSPAPVHLPPALSPSVSVHIVKSPAPVPSPLILPSPHSSQPSPCITDDELMDEALVGLGK